MLFPAVLLAAFAVVQGALYYHARDVALAAASDGLDSGAVAAREQPRKGDVPRRRSCVGPVAATSCLRQRCRPSGRHDRARHGQRTRVSLLPGVPGWALEQTASGPVERLTQAGEP